MEAVRTTTSSPKHPGESPNAIVSKRIEISPGLVILPNCRIQS